ncbi:MAG: fumarylacetoacetate hydrolase family protein [Verrucomicrobium sp.]|nr:fumarylacetoacetate hydrolase family protein [Verrucomicrobium sp.]
MILFRTPSGPVLQHENLHYAVKSTDWDALLNQESLPDWLLAQAVPENEVAAPLELLAPVGTQEVWASGVTYFRSRNARMEESKDAGGADFYQKVYEAERPELFFKATPQRVVGPGGVMHRRKDSTWIVPEPELTLVINSQGQIIGYTCGNDLSCRDIEGENPLYLPQAKVFTRCAGLGPGILIAEKPIPVETAIHCEIFRDGQQVFAGDTTLAQMKRTPVELVGWLYREETFPVGCFLMTGTGIVPPDNFCLQAGDEVRVSIEGIGTLINFMD